MADTFFCNHCLQELDVVYKYPRRNMCKTCFKYQRSHDNRKYYQKNYEYIKLKREINEAKRLHRLYREHPQIFAEL
jgi:hypothetical protein